GPPPSRPKPLTLGGEFARVAKTGCRGTVHARVAHRREPSSTTQRVPDAPARARRGMHWRARRVARDGAAVVSEPVRSGLRLRDGGPGSRPGPPSGPAAAPRPPEDPEPSPGLQVAQEASQGPSRATEPGRRQGEAKVAVRGVAVQPRESIRPL